MSVRNTLLVLALIATPVFAQSGTRGGGFATVGPSQVGGLGTGAGGFIQPSTALGAELAGLAALEEARGKAALYRAQAAVVREQARAAALENRYEQVRQSYQLQDTRAERRRESLKVKAARLAKRRKDRTIAALVSEPSPIPALVDWPAVVQAERYAKLRTEVEGLIELRNQLGEENAATSVALKKALGSVVAQATFDVANRRIASSEYETTKQFVRNLSRRYIAPDLVNDSHRKTMLAMSDG